MNLIHQAELLLCQVHRVDFTRVQVCWLVFIVDEVVFPTLQKMVNLLRSIQIVNGLPLSLVIEYIEVHERTVGEPIGFTECADFLIKCVDLVEQASFAFFADFGASSHRDFRSSLFCAKNSASLPDSFGELTSMADHC